MKVSAGEVQWKNLLLYKAGFRVELCPKVHDEDTYNGSGEEEGCGSWHKFIR